MLGDGTAGQNREQKRGRDRAPTRSPTGDGVEARPDRAPHPWRRRGALSRRAGRAAKALCPGARERPVRTHLPGLGAAARPGILCPPPPPGALRSERAATNRRRCHIVTASAVRGGASGRLGDRRLLVLQPVNQS